MLLPHIERGTVRVIGTRKSPGIKGCVVSCNSDKDDLEYLQSLADSLQVFPVVATLAGGASYAGVLAVNGELALSSQNATVSFDLVGEGKLKRQ